MNSEKEKTALKIMIENVSKMTKPLLTQNHRIYTKEVLLKALNDRLKTIIDIEKQEGDK